MANQGLIPEDIAKLYEIRNYKFAAEVLASGSTNEFKELIDGLREFRITLDDIRKPGGNESEIPKTITAIFREKGPGRTQVNIINSLKKSASPEP
jgi:hypothetical protein